MHDVVGGHSREVRCYLPFRSRLVSPFRRHDIFDGRKKVCFVMEFLRGGELYDIIADAKYFSEEVRRKVYNRKAVPLY